MSLSAGLLAVGSWRIFRPDSWVAAAATAALGILLAAFYLVLLFADHHGRPPMQHPTYLIGFAIRISPFAWIAFESLRYSGMLRRQVTLGLAESFIARRFLLWGLAGCTAFVTFMAFLSSVLLGRPLAELPVALPAMGAFGLLSAIFMWTAFFPPAFYRRLVAAEGQAELRY